MNINYGKDHQFEHHSYYINIEKFKCKICGLIVWKSLGDSSFVGLSYLNKIRSGVTGELSCEDIIIKQIIE